VRGWFETDSRTGRLKATYKTKEKVALRSSYHAQSKRSGILDSTDNTRTAKGNANTMLRSIRRTGG